MPRSVPTVAALVLAGLVALPVPLAVPAAAAAGSLRLPTPSDARRTSADLLVAVGARPDRVLASRAPGPVQDEERVRVGLDGGGAPAGVELDQRLVLQGQGDFSVRERGPARGTRGDPDDLPVLRLGTVVWQGFTSGDPPRELAATLVLDPALEQPRLPLSVSVLWTPPAGAPRPLGPGGSVPGPGTVVVELRNATGQPAQLPTADDADDGPVAAALDAARTAAAAPAGQRLPAAGAGLPTDVPVTGAGTRGGTQQVPLRVTGRIGLVGTGGSVSGPGTTASAGGATVAGTLGSAPARLTVAVAAAGRLDLDLTVVPALDARTLVPPGGAASWQAWAAARPDLAARRSALTLLVDVAAQGARAAAFSPYLGLDLPGTGSTQYRYAFRVPDRAVAVSAPLRPHPRALALAGLAGLLVAAGAVAVWRQA